MTGSLHGPGRPQLEILHYLKRGDLISLLNGRPTRLSREVLAFITDLEKLKKPNGKSVSLMNVFDDRLRNCTARPQMAFSSIFGFTFVSSYRVVPKWTDHSRWIWALIDFDLRGHLGLLARCGQCQKWFFGRARTNRFCSRRCKQKFHRSSPEYRYEWKHRMKYYRQYNAGDTKLSWAQWKRKNMLPFQGGNNP